MGDRVLCFTYMAIEDGQKPTEFKGFNVRKLTKLVNFVK